MKKAIVLLILIGLLSASFVSGVEYVLNFTMHNSYSSSNSNLEVQQLKYEPYPVNPGEYFDLWIKVENVGEELTKDAIFELIPKYPFSLDPNEEAVREYGQLGIKPVVLEYKVRVDKDAVEGTNEIELRYKANKYDTVWAYEKFDIQVDDAQTDFDLVIQEVSGTEVNIAIANIGKNVAYSVIVKVPDQETYETNGISGQMIGNLENGDYTLVSFDITKTSKRSEDPLKLQIDYTDNIGERRSLIKEIDFDTGTTNNFQNITATSENAYAARRTSFQSQQTATYQQWWFWLIVVIVLYVVWKGYKKHKKRKEEKEERKHKR